MTDSEGVCRPKGYMPKDHPATRLFIDFDPRGMSLRLVDEEGNAAPGGMLAIFTPAGSLRICDDVPADLMKRAGLSRAPGGSTRLSFPEPPKASDGYAPSDSTEKGLGSLRAEASNGEVSVGLRGPSNVSLPYFATLAPDTAFIAGLMLILASNKAHDWLKENANG